ncbi:putative glycosyl transferase, group 1 family protein [uncultured delta proteobacterium]|uniref:Putative glycosyl transferase, group 1 family protein n=1 Tax=uncultured delta proteobacterium TaxID=34034 RepID=A0A212KH28_9DELT|nr:putative glycosyl transferase, group 1 family protein [uncultured delta proteobacterium]
MRLLVIIPDMITDILKKGEYQPLYYNPGEFADEVHLLLTNTDTPPLGDLQRTVGKARLFLHNLPVREAWASSRLSFLTSSRLKRWAQPGVELARNIQPDLIRCHSADWNAYLAARIKKEIGIPYCVSLHINPDTNPLHRHFPAVTAAQKRRNAFYEFLEGEGLRGADKILPVYKPILPYLERHGIPEDRIQVAYNILNIYHLSEKTSYEPHHPFRLVCVGRLFDLKNPDNIIKAVAAIPDTVLTIIGDGPARPALESLTAGLGISDRVVFIPAMENDALCGFLPEQDAFVVHTEHFEINKSVLEALLTGLPVIINRREGAQVPEFEEGEFVWLVENTPEAYQKAIQIIMDNDDSREALGRKAYAHSRERWAPRKTEAEYVAIYNAILGQSHG